MKRLTYILLPLSMSLLTPSLMAEVVHCPSPEEMTWVKDSGTPGQWDLVAPPAYMGNVVNNGNDITPPAQITADNTQFDNAKVTANTSANIVPNTCSYTSSISGISRIKLVHIAYAGMLEKYQAGDNFVKTSDAYETCSADTTTRENCTWTVTKRIPGPPIPPTQP